MKKSVIFSFLTAVFAIAVISCGGEDEPADAKVSIKELGLAAPVAGQAPATSVSTAEYTGTATWKPAAASVFAHSTEYESEVNLTAAQGFTFDGVPANFFTCAGATSVTHAAGSGRVTVKFPQTAALPDVKVSISVISGLTPPVAGATPVTSITATDQFTGTVTWEPAATTFAHSTAYTAKVTLTAKTGFTFAGLPANHFTVAGATSAGFNAAGGELTVVFPKTADAGDVKVSISAISGLTPPAAGATPVTSITATDQFTGTVTWEPAAATFAHSTAYTARVSLTAKPGFTFTGVAADFFTVAGATGASFNAANGELTVAFPKTADAGEPAGEAAGFETLKITGTPKVDWKTFTLANWEPGDYLTLTWTNASVEGRMYFDDGSSEDMTLSNQSFSIVVKFESRWTTVQVPRLIVYTSVESTPRQFEIDKEKTTPTLTTGYFGFAKDKEGKYEFLLNYTITNPLVSIRGQQVPLIGTLVMTDVMKRGVSSFLHNDGKWYDVYNVIHDIEFRLGNFKQKLPVHYTQMAEPAR